MMILLVGLEARSQQVGPDKKLQFVLEYQDLYTTHRDHFRGGSLTVARQYSNVLRLGVGVEYATNNYHLDNDWNLTHLHFLPVYIDQQLKPRNSKKLYPMLHFSEGLSYITYKKEIIADPGIIEQRREAGIYFYGGGGLTWKISPRVSLVGEAGFKGFHMSFDEYQVNPHGITYRLGLVF